MQQLVLRKPFKLNRSSMSTASIAASLKAFKSHATRHVNKAKTLLEGDCTNLESLGITLNNLQSKLSEVEAYHIKLLEKYFEENHFSDEEQQNKFIDEQADYQDEVSSYIFRLKEKIKSLNINKAENSDNNSNTKSEVNIKLPQIQLERFDGSYAKWTSFWDCFQSNIHDRSDLTNVNKLTYLKSILDGNAKERVRNLPVTDANYDKVITILKNTYADTNKIKWDLIYTLGDVPYPSNNFSDLDSFRTTIASCLANLEVHKIDIDTGSIFIVPFLFRKLPFKVRESIQTRSGKDYPNIKEFMKALDQIVANLSSFISDKRGSSNVDRTDHNSGRNKMNRPNQVNLSEVNKADIGNFKVGIKSESAQSINPACIFCSEKHASSKCNNYPSVEKRKTRAQELNRCTKCLRKAHDSENCTTNLWTCNICGLEPHHSFFCVKTTNQVQVSISSTVPTTDSQESDVCVIPTASLKVNTSHGIKQIRCMFDPGAQKSFISSNMCKQLGLTPHSKCNLQISGFLNRKDMSNYDIVTLKIIGSTKSIDIDVVVIDHLPDVIFAKGIGEVVESIKELGICLADPDIQGDKIPEINLLIGLDNYYEFFTPPERIKGVHIVDTSVGKVIIGKLPKTKNYSPSHCNSILVNRLAVEQTFNSEEPPIHKLWELDAIGLAESQFSPEEYTAMQEFNKTIKFVNNRYEICLPWKSNHMHLPNNYGLAVGRLKSTFKKLQQQKGHIKIYGDIINDQLKQGFIEKVENPVVDENCHYLPHMGVIKDSTTTPLRIVFDCSARLKKGLPSLNDCLLTGPSLTEQLVKVLLKFRLNPYAFIADISKAFLRVGLNETDRDFTRFIWYSNPENKESDLITYRFRSVLFGATCSPFLLQACLKYHFQKYKNDEVAMLLSNNFYVDNLQATVSSEGQLSDIVNRANTIMTEAGMPLQEWVSNSKELNNEMKTNDYFIKDDKGVTKVLGIIWNYDEDILKFKPVKFENSEYLSKRILLSDVSKFYDPLGLMSPISIKGKMLIQKVWEGSYEWDQDLPKEIKEEWEKLKTDYISLSDFKIKRHIYTTGASYELHLFCDASSKGYGSVAYLNSEKEGCNLVMSKSRVAPLNKKTIPQLELTAMVVGAKLGNYIRECFKNEIKINQEFIWSDSEIAIQWVINKNSKDTYVKNRVENIERLGNFQFKHVGSKHNPADLISRGCTIKNIISNELWYHGPSWLPCKTSWPEQPSKLCIETNVEVNINLANKQKSILEPERFSKFRKLINVTKLVLTFISKTRKNYIKDSNVESQALKLIIKETQQRNFIDCISYCKNPKNKKPELVHSLNLFIDSDNILRCQGRLSNANLPYETVHPILIPKNDHVTRLLINDRHLKVKHGGVQDTMTKLREEFWIIKARQTIKNVLHTCFICKKLEGHPLKSPISPDLPEYRVNENLKPFEVSGVDYTGNILITNKETKLLDKYYVVLFTCAMSRAVHLELVTNLSAESFINAFRRFIARRGCPKLMISDNATNFTSSSKLIQEMFDKTDINVTLDENACKWQFIPARSPHFGGFYERLIGIVKSCLKKTLYKKKIYYDDLLTIITEVEQRVNHRPLTYVDDSLDDLQPLTPSHLLYGRRLSSFPTVVDLDYQLDPNYLNTKTLNKSVSKLNQILNDFNRKWKNEYLLSLREFHSRNCRMKIANPQLNVNDVVLIHDDGPRCKWKLGRIIELLPGKDDIVRVVKIKINKGEFYRSIQKLYLLESHQEENKDNDQTQKSILHHKKPIRATAQKFKDNLKSMINAGTI